MIKLSIVLASTPVELEGVDGKTDSYRIQEMVAAERDRYMDVLRPRIDMDKEGNATNCNKYEGLQAELLCRCLHRDNGDLVPESIIQSWPASVVQVLYKEAQRINKIGAAGEETKGEIKKGSEEKGSSGSN